MNLTLFVSYVPIQICDEFDVSKICKSLESTLKLVYSSENEEICEDGESKILSTTDFFSDSMTFDEEIIKEIIHEENQEENISFYIISIEGRNSFDCACRKR